MKTLLRLGKEAYGVEQGLSDFLVFQTDGSWRVVQFKYSSGAFIYVEHNCPEERFDDWHGCRYTYSSFPVPCAACKQLVPEGLQGVYVLVSDDMDVHAEPWLLSSDGLPVAGDRRNEND